MYHIQYVASIQRKFGPPGTKLIVVRNDEIFLVHEKNSYLYSNVPSSPKLMNDVNPGNIYLPDLCKIQIVPIAAQSSPAAGASFSAVPSITPSASSKRKILHPGLAVDMMRPESSVYASREIGIEKGTLQ